MKNTGYFLKETGTMLKLNILSNVLSILSIGLILFIFSMIISAWWISGNVVKIIQNEAEISAYYKEDLDSISTNKLLVSIKNIEGINGARIINEEEAYKRMEKILGQEARVLTYFDTNPFSSYIEIKIDLNKMDQVLIELNKLSNIDHVRDNKEILDRLKSISRVFNYIGYLIIAAVGISTLVIISHIIRMGVYNNREQIDTLRLLGAPETFIAIPFIFEGLILTLVGGILSLGMTYFSLDKVYSQLSGTLSFIPLPIYNDLLLNMILVIISLSSLLGIAGSMLGLSSDRG